MIHCSAFTRIGESNMTQIKKVGGSDRRTETEIIPYDGGASRRAFDLNHGRWLHWDGFEMLLLVMQMEDLALVSQSIVSFWFQMNLSHLETLHIVLTPLINNCMFLQGGPLLNSGERQKDQSQIEGRPKNYSEKKSK